jgi:hypothetical protein
MGHPSYSGQAKNSNQSLKPMVALIGKNEIKGILQIYQSVQHQVSNYYQVIYL